MPYFAFSIHEKMRYGFTDGADKAPLPLNTKDPLTKPFLLDITFAC
jgi:hypothetical protein